MTATKKLILSLSVLLTSCATHSTRDRILRDMAIGASLGVLLAQTKSDNQAAYSYMYGGVGAAAAGALSVSMNASTDDHLEQENDRLTLKLSQLEKQMQPKLVQQGHSLFASPIPKEVSALVEPGEWRRYKLDQWVQDPNQPNTWYRQIEMFEIIPPASK